MRVLKDKNPKLLFILFAVATGFIFTYQNCEQPRYAIKDKEDALPDIHLSDNELLPENPNTPGDVVCDPNSIPTSSQSGLVAELYYMTDKQKENATSVLNFFDPTMAKKSTQTLYFSQVNVSPQVFTKGFVTQTGELVKDDSGNTLFEWFALKYISELSVSNVSDEGFYEFAALTDDGAILEAFIDGKWETVVNGDGVHPTKMSCSNITLELKKDKPVPLRLYYYQGPHDEIANVLHWRRIPMGKAPIGDTECGKSGATRFHDPATSLPKAPYTNFLNRGWEVVPATAFTLPSTLTNPCVNK